MKASAKIDRPAAFSKLAVPPAYKVVSDTIERAIMEGQLAIGDLLPTEIELADQFGLTRHTVREGLRLLEQSGLVRRDSSRRLSVSTPLQSELASNATRALILHAVSYSELWQVSRALEIVAIECVMDKIDDSFLEGLRLNVHQTVGALEAGKSVVALDQDFHRKIAEQGNNKALILAREPTALLYHPALRLIFNNPLSHPQAPQRLVQAHNEIIAAFAAQDIDRAMTWTVRHMDDFKRACERCGIDLYAPVDGQLM